MLTRCPNEECGQTYKIKPEFIGQRARCKRCQNVFLVEHYFRNQELIDLPVEDETEEEQSEKSERGTGRRSSKEIMRDRINVISDHVNDILPSLLTAHKRQENESNTRLLIDMIRAGRILLRAKA